MLELTPIFLSKLNCPVRHKSSNVVAQGRSRFAGGASHWSGGLATIGLPFQGLCFGSPFFKKLINILIDISKHHEATSVTIFK